jgi:hypothetical protein
VEHSDDGIIRLRFEAAIFRSVILSEAKDLLTRAAKENRSFASLRMNSLVKARRESYAAGLRLAGRA